MNFIEQAYSDANRWFNKTVLDLLSQVNDLKKIKNCDDRERKEAFVVVYGHTKSGKTTLILKLMRIRDDRFSDLYISLCGKRGTCESTTPSAAFIYKKSESQFSITVYNSFEKNFPPMKIANLDELSENISDIRDKISRSKGIYSVTISIPMEYFDEDKDRIDVEIVDLPGEYCQDANESAKAKEIYEFYLQRATCVFFVAPEDKLADVLKRSINSQKNNVLPSKRRVVLSQFGCSDTESKRLEKGECDFSLESVRSYYHSKLERGLEISKEHLYLFNAGISWEKMKHKYKDNIKECINAFYEEIIKDINQSANPASILRQFSDSEREIIKALEEQDILFEEKLKLINEKKSHVEYIIKNYDEQIKEFGDISESEELIDKIGEENNFYIEYIKSNDIMFKTNPDQFEELYKINCLNFNKKVIDYSFQLKLILEKKLMSRDDMDKKFYPQPILTDEFNYIYSQKKTKWLWFIPINNKNFPPMISDYINNQLKDHQKRCNPIFFDIIELVTKRQQGYINMYCRHRDWSNKRIKNLTSCKEVTCKKLENQLEQCHNYLANIEKEFSQFYFKTRAISNLDTITIVANLIELYFIAKSISNAQRSST
jgi:hypothetical protein